MKELKNRYFLLRHGQTDKQPEEAETVYRKEDDNFYYSLSEFGKQQIKERTVQLKKENINLIFSSDLSRTKQSVDIIAKELNLPVHLDKRLRDTNWGVLHGKTFEEAWGFYNHDMEKRFQIVPPEGESWQDLRERVIEFLEELEKKYNQKNILIVSHGDPLWIIESWIKDLNHKESLAIRKEGCPMKMGELKQFTGELKQFN